MEAAVNGGDIEKKVNGASKRKRISEEDGLPIPLKRRLVDVDSTDSDSEDSMPSATQPDTTDFNNLSDVSRAESNSQLVRGESHSCAENDIHSFDKCFDSPEETLLDSSPNPIECNATSSESRSFGKGFNHLETEADAALTSNDDSKQSFDSSAEQSKVAKSPPNSSEDIGNTSNPSADNHMFDKCFDSSKITGLDPQTESQSSTKCSESSENESVGQRLADHSVPSDSQSSDKCLNISDAQIDSKTSNSSQSFEKCLGSAESFRHDFTADHMSSDQGECFERKTGKPEETIGSVHEQSSLTFSECLKRSGYNTANQFLYPLAKCANSEKNTTEAIFQSNADRSDAHIELTLFPSDNSTKTNLEAALIPVGASSESEIELIPLKNTNDSEMTNKSDTIPAPESSDTKTQLNFDPNAVSSDTIEGYLSPLADSSEMKKECSLEPSANSSEASKENLYPDLDTSESLPKCANMCNEMGADVLDLPVNNMLSSSIPSTFEMCLDGSDTLCKHEFLSCASPAVGECLLSETQTEAEYSTEKGEELKPSTKGMLPEEKSLVPGDEIKLSVEELAAKGEELLELGSGSLEAAELRAAARRGPMEAEGRGGQEEYAQYLGLTPTVKFRCSRCSVATFETLQRLQSHQSRGGCSRASGSAAAAGGTNFRITRKVYLCSACGTYYEHSELFLHMRQEHARHICLFCLSMYISAEKLSAHLCARHEASMDAEWTPHACFLECVGCERVFSESDDVAYHACQPDRTLSTAIGEMDATIVQSSECSKEVSCLADTPPDKGEAKRSTEDVSLRLVEDVSEGPSEELAMSQPFVSDEPEPSGSRLQMALEAKLPEDNGINRQPNLESSLNSLVPSIGMKSPVPSVASPAPCTISPAASVRSPRGSIPESPNPSSDCVSESRFPGVVEPSIADVLGIQADEAVIMPLPPTSASPSAHPDSAKAVRRKPKRPRRRAAPRKRKPPVKQPREPEPEVVALAGREAPLLPLPALSAEPASELLRACVLAAAAGCVYCNHARLIAVCARQLLLHLLAEHRFLPAAAPTEKPRLDSRSEDMDVDVCLSPVKLKEEEKLEEQGAEGDDTDDETTLARKEAEAMEVSMWLKAALLGAEGWHINADTFDSRDNAAGKSWDGNYECFHCHLQVRQHKELYLHNRKLHQKTCLLCVMCKRNFYSYSELLCHRCPGLYVPGALPAGFRCPLCCRGDLPSAFRLMVHMRREHHACDVCLVTTGDQPRLQAHVWKHKLAHVCLRCGIAYRNKPDITKHLFWKHGTESAACRRCLQKKWPHVYHFCQPPQHFVCEDCPRRFSRAVALRVHRRIHSSAPLPYACTECEERVVSRRLLERHKVKHEAPPPAPPPPEPELPPEPPAAPTPPPPPAPTTPPPVEQSRKKSRKSKQRAPVVDVYDLPPLNLSSDSDSEGEPEATAAVTDGVAQIIDATPDTEAVAGGSGVTDSTQKKKPSEDRAVDDGELPVPDAVPSVWDDFRQYKARLEAERERTPAEQLESVMADHDYCVVPATGPPVPTVTDNDHDYCSPTKGATTASAPPKPVTPPPPPPVEPPAPPKPAPSSSSSSSSSSSCSCGPDCSCSSSSSTDSSSDSSTREGRQRQEGRRRGRKLKILPVMPPTEEPPPVEEEPPPPEPDEEAERESDLDTSEPETDEEFYDTHPSLATGLPRGAATPAAPPGASGSPARHDKKRKHRRHTKPEVATGVPLLPLPPGVKRRPKPKRFFGDSDEEAASVEQPPPPVMAPNPPPVARVPPIVIMAAPLAVTPPSSDSEDEPALVIASPPPPLIAAPVLTAPVVPIAGTASGGGATGSNLFCYCQCPYDEVSEMIACDGASCRIEWFHFECVGIMVPPQGKWFCPDCRRDNDAR